jgi:hypothetical protein
LRSFQPTLARASIGAFGGLGDADGLQLGFEADDLMGKGALAIVGGGEGGEQVIGNVQADSSSLPSVKRTVCLSRGRSMGFGVGW